MKLSDEALQQLMENGTMPSQLVSGYEALDGRAAELAMAQIGEVVEIREQRRQEKVERERVAAEAARKADEERRARKRAAAQAKADAEAARRARYEKGMGETLTRISQVTGDNRTGF